MDYAALQDVAQRYADRTDQEVIDMFDSFLALAEARINRLLKTREQTARVHTPTVKGQKYYPLPPDYRGMRDIQITSPRPTQQDVKVHPMTYISPQEYNKRENDHHGGEMYYTIIANQIQILPALDAGSSIEMIYYQKVPPLTPTATENWLSLEHPDVYISALTGEISLFVKDYEVADGWFNRLKEAINEMVSSDVTERWTGAPLTMRIEP